MSEFRSDVLDLSDLTDRKILLRPSNLLSRILQRLRWFFASGTRLIALLLLAIGLPGVMLPSGLARSYTAISPALVAVGLAVLLLDTANELRAERERKAEWIVQMGSPDNAFAVEAARQLRARGWLEDGSLRGARLLGANLQRADLVGADLQGASIWNANLEGAEFRGASLQGAFFTGSNLQGADFRNANLQEGSLQNANLQGANFEEANLHRVDLLEANLQGANLRHANLRVVRLWAANLQGADLSHADLHGALCLAPEQLRQAGTLQGATLPDGTKLPDDDTWRSAFEAWCETVEVDENGHIVPTPLED